jgi:hypothetical protein
MQTDAADRDRPTVRVVCRIANTLEIRSDRPLFRGAPGVVGFDDLLGPVVIQPAVANDEAKTAVRKKSLLVARQIVPNAGDADVIGLPPPEVPVYGDPAAEGAIDLRIRL